MTRLLFIILAPLYLLGSEHPFDAYIAGVLLLCCLCGVLAAVAGVIQGDQPGALSLNHWDEVLAYYLVAALARGVAWILG